MNHTQEWQTFQTAMDKKDWKTARNLIAQHIDADQWKLAKEMNHYFKENVCQDCDGTGQVIYIRGDLKSQKLMKCICQK